MSDTRQWKEKICCIGAGYVGGPTMAVIAKHCPDYRVVVVDINQQRIDAWNSRQLPVFEPLLQETIDCAIKTNNNLFFSTEVDREIDDASIIFVAVATPTKTYGRGAGRAFDMSAWDAVSRNIARVARSDKIIIEKSTVPVRTAEKVMRILKANRTDPSVQFHVVSNPEFLAEGSAIRNLEEPERVLIGGNTSDDPADDETHASPEAVQRVVELYANWVPLDRIITTNLWSSELAKLASNAFLAQRISSINAVSAICEEVGADVQEISKVLGMDPRINNKYLSASVGFGGSCLRKDVLAMVYLCESLQLHEVAEYWKSIVTINEFQKERFAIRILDTMNDSVRNKKLAVMGFAFKKDTGDTRDTCAFEIVKFLLNEGANVHIYDPQVPHKEILEYFPKVTVHSNAKDAMESAHALVILTEWDEFKDYDYEDVYHKMNKPAFVFDGRNILPHDRLLNIGFHVHAIGKRSRHLRVGF